MASDVRVKFDGNGWIVDGFNPDVVIHPKTHKRYHRLTSSEIRNSGCKLTASFPLQGIGTVVMMVKRMWDIVTCYSCVSKQDYTSSRSWRPFSEVRPSKLKRAAKDAVKIVFAPILYVGLQLSACFLMCCPHRSRRCYPWIEQTTYQGNWTQAPLLLELEECI